MQIMTRTTGDIAAFNHAVVAAVMQSGQIMSVFGVIGIDPMERGHSLAWNTITTAMREAGSLALQTMNLVHEALTPLAQQVTVAVERFNQNPSVSSGASIPVTVPSVPDKTDG